MAGRIRLGRRGGRVVVVLATAAYVTGLGIAAAPPGQTFGGSCNGHLSQPGFDASHERGPVIIIGTDEPDVIIGSRGDDTIDGKGGDDIICGGGGADNIRGGEGDDRIFGEGGDDTLSGDEGDDFVSGGEGNDDIDGGYGHNLLYGDGGDDVLDGTESDPGSKLVGGRGWNRCFVGPGSETYDCRF
jgi:Ca2+-binding RTX toxin-like protein